ncbi:MAG: cytochrome c1 [Paracoccaceae bacterium]|nr:cytochrome c1 [Paracoccaceae bacterium]
MTAMGGMLSGMATAAETEQHIEDVSFSYEGPFGKFDRFQLQRGFQVFHEVCSACHGLRYLSFRELGSETGPAFPEEQVKAIAALYEVADEEGEPGDTRPGKPFDNFPANTGAGAPDLSLMAKARAGFHGPYGLGINQLINGIGGAEYIYSLLTGYTGEEVEEAGAILYENTAFAGGKISMAPPLDEGLVEYAMHGGEEGQSGAKAPEASVEQMSEDVSAFLMWAAEPKMTERKQSGFRNIVWLAGLTVLLYFTNKALWAKVKRKE